MAFFRSLLFPFSVLYLGITSVRNFCYNSGFIKAYRIPNKSICVGNLSVGGTGKSPMVSFLADYFKEKQKVALLSRGYGRKSKGFLEVTIESISEQVGDEPLMYKKKFKDALNVYVCEDRTSGIRQIIDNKGYDLLILDDAFQHRRVKAGLNIVLSDFNKPFFRDFHLPSGNLRESKGGIKRADMLVYTKCDEFPNQATQLLYASKSAVDKTHIFYSKIVYGDLLPFDQMKQQLQDFEKILLVSGIANPKPLERFLREKYDLETFYFSDHHQFSAKDLQEISKKFDTFATEKKAIVTTEKDYIRLLEAELSSLTSERPWFYQTMTIAIDRENEFLKKLNEYVGTI